MKMEEKLMTPVWQGDTVYEESVMYIRGKDGAVPAAPLLYTPEKILEVRSSDGTRTYESGRDYALKDGLLYRTEDSAIPCWEYEEFYPSQGEEIPIASRKESGRFIRYDRGDVYALSLIHISMCIRDRRELSKQPRRHLYLAYGRRLGSGYGGDSRQCHPVWG